ncbi:astacin-like metalloprotease toxin 2 [Hydractinia symbiolongicarpus]|uniref:astacin-like metalloprotease toxin 2 n=1 Tax=Hydractinia symbiolongicarpus TaxID=13093 RepID=UPI002549C6DA|nr:astacin-like metalloprotease toxin 2 [Hydractinia symbiolongicarpus]
MHYMFSSLHETVVMRLLIAILMVCAVYGNWVDEMWNPGLFEGDILLNPQQREEIKAGRFEFASVKHKLWPNAVIPYEISGELTWEKKAMKELDEAIKQYHTYTCLRFKRRTTEKGYIEFYKGGGCSSPVGYSGRRNGVSLSSGCWWRATIMHEIGHSLGKYSSLW